MQILLKTITKILAVVSLCLPLCAQRAMFFGQNVVAGGGGGGIGYSFVDYAYFAEDSGSNASITSTSTITLSTGDAVMVTFRCSGSGHTATFSDDVGNTYTSKTEQDWLSGGASIQSGYSLNVSHTGSTHITATFDSAATFCSMIALHYSISGGSGSFDVESTGTASGTNTATSSAFTTTAKGIAIMCGTIPAIQGFTAGDIGGSPASLRATAASALADGDMACEDLSFAVAQVGITASILTSTPVEWGFTVESFK